MSADEPSFWADLPVRAVGSALVALDRANQTRSALVDSWIPGPLGEALKNPIPDVGDTLFSIARSHLEQINALFKLGQGGMSRLAGGWTPPVRSPRLELSLGIRADQKTPESARRTFKNRLSREVLPCPRFGSFMTRDGLKTDKITISGYSFEPNGKVAGGGTCTLTVSILIAGPCKEGEWYFLEGEIVGDGERLALLTIELEVLKP